MSLAFEVTDQSAGCITMLLRGELGAASVTTFHAALAEALSCWPTLLQIDMAAVAAVDPAGVAVLAAARRVGEVAGYRVVVVAAHGHVADVLRRNGLTTCPTSDPRDPGHRA